MYRLGCPNSTFTPLGWLCFCLSFHTSLSLHKTIWHYLKNTTVCAFNFWQPHYFLLYHKVYRANKFPRFPFSQFQKKISIVNFLSAGPDIPVFRTMRHLLIIHLVEISFHWNERCSLWHVKQIYGIINEMRTKGQLSVGEELAPICHSLSPICSHSFVYCTYFKQYSLLK